MKKRKKSSGTWYLFLLPMIEGIGIWSMVIAAILGFSQIVFTADKLGWFFVPTLIAYFSIIAAIAGFFYSRRMRVYQHSLMGDELFYKTFPFERWLHNLQVRRAEKRKAVKQQ